MRCEVGRNFVKLWGDYSRSAVKFLPQLYSFPLKQIHGHPRRWWLFSVDINLEDLRTYSTNNCCGQLFNGVCGYLHLVSISVRTWWSILLCFQVEYDFAGSILNVTIVKCEDLAAMDIGGTSDPYVKVYLLPDRKRKQVGKLYKCGESDLQISFHWWGNSCLLSQLL